MIKLASIALTSVLGVAGVGASLPAAAHPYVSVGIALPGVVVEPVGYAPVYGRPYYVGGYGRYWYPDCDRYRYEHRRWDHDWDHHRDHDWDHRRYRR